VRECRKSKKWGENIWFFPIQKVLFWWFTEKIGKFWHVTLNFSAFSGVKKNGRYIFQLPDELKVTRCYILYLLEGLKITAVSFKK